MCILFLYNFGLHAYYLTGFSSMHHYPLIHEGDTRSLLSSEIDTSAQIENRMADQDEVGDRIIQPIQETRQHDVYEFSECSPEPTYDSSNVLANMSFQGTDFNPPNDRRFACRICSKRFQFLCRLRVHLRSHTGDRPYVCKVCKKSFSQSCNLKTHKRLHCG